MDYKIFLEKQIFMWTCELRSAKAEPQNTQAEQSRILVEPSRTKSKKFAAFFLFCKYSFSTTAALCSLNDNLLSPT